jgi:hypothetical protein
MTGYLTIDADDAKKLCGRLEFDASWDKAGPGYYDLNKQIKAYLSVGVGSFVAYSYPSLLRAIAARLTSEDDEAPVSDCATAVEKRNELLGELAHALKDNETLVRLIASQPALVSGRLDRAPTNWDVETILKGKVLSNIKVALNDVIAEHLIKHNIHVNPALEYAKCVTDIIEKWQRKHKKDMGSFPYNQSDQLKANLSLLAKGKHVLFTKNEIAKFVSREIREKADLRAFFVADEVLTLSGALDRARKAAKRAAKASVMGHS